MTTADAPQVTGPEIPPAPTRNIRLDLANVYLRGSGIEVGALHLPMQLPTGSLVRYVDRMSVPDLRRHYAELAGYSLVDVDVIDDGETLRTIAPSSVDFIVANHFLEHCEDPIRTLQTHLGKLRPGGVLFYAVPDMRFTFDWQRTRTTLEHLIADHERGPQISRADHYVDWVFAGLVPGFVPTVPQEQVDKAGELEREGYSIHFHVWTEADLVRLFLYCRRQFQNFELETVRRNGIENIVVLRKHGRPLAGVAAVPTATTASTARREAVNQPLELAAQRPGVPLASLRETLDDGSARAQWATGLDGLDGRAWIIATDAPVSIPIVLDAPVRLHSRACLIPHDWRDGTGAVGAWVAAFDAAGRRRELWSGRLARDDDPTGAAIDCEVPAGTARLSIGGDARGPHRDGSIGRFALREPRLEWTGAPAPPPVDPLPSTVDGPLISILCPVHDPPLSWLDEALRSVLGQTYSSWELVIVDDGSRQPEIVTALGELDATDERVRLFRHEEAGGISAATNAALSRARGEFVALLDHDDTLTPDALAYVAGALERYPATDMLYSDEDIVLDGHPVWVHLKPDWSPDTENTNGYTCHLAVHRRSLLQEIGGFRTEFNGSQDVDVVLRMSERTDRIVHIPRILYHWRIHGGSTAGGAGKPYAWVAARRAIEEHLNRAGIEAEVQHAPPGLYRVVHRVDPSTSVAIVVIAPDPEPLARAARSWRAQLHQAFGVVVATPPARAGAVSHALAAAGLGPKQVQVVEAEPDANRGAALAVAAGRADADALLLMERPMAGLSGDWMPRLIGYAGQPGISAAGPFVLSADGRVAYGGVAVPAGAPVPLIYGLRPRLDEFFGYGTAVYNVAALDGALMSSRVTFERLGGLDPSAGSLALVEYCLRAESELGLRAVTIGDARLQLAGAAPVVNDLPAIRSLAQRRSGAADPYYSSGFRADRGDFVATA